MTACREGTVQPPARAAFFSFFLFCFSFVESFGLLSFFAFSIPLATAASLFRQDYVQVRADVTRVQSGVHAP